MENNKGIGPVLSIVAILAWVAIFVQYIFTDCVRISGKLPEMCGPGGGYVIVGMFFFCMSFPAVYIYRRIGSAKAHKN